VKKIKIIFFSKNFFSAKFFQFYFLFSKMRKRKNESQIEMQVALFRSKVKDELDQRLEITLKPNCYRIDGKIFMMCVVCKEVKERTTENFYPDYNGKNFETSRAGHECLKNSPLKPCIRCQAMQNCEFYRNQDGFVYRLVAQHKSTGLTIEWFYEILNQQHDVGPISGQKLQLVPSALNSVGIHAHDNDKEHTPDNCFLEIQSLNVPQHEAIPCLFCAWKQLYNCILHQYMFPKEQDNSKHLEYVRSQYFVSVIDLNITGYGANPQFYEQQRRRRHFPSILRSAIQNHINHDIKKKRFELPRNIPRKEYLKIVYDNSIQQLEKQSWRCAYSNVNLTIANIWTRFSFVRIDDDLPHFTQLGELTNIVFICRSLNTPKKLSKEIIMDMLLHQNLLPIPEYIRLQINPNSSKDWVAPKVWTQREIDLFEFISSDFTNNTLSCDYCFLKNQIK
jgi:hypothetical protein